MKLCIRQKVFSFRDKFYVTDENGNQVYYIESEFFTFLKKFHIYSISGEEVGYIEQQFNLFLPRLDIYIYGELAASLQKHFTLFCQEYTAEGPDWSISGDFFCHDYQITHSGEAIAYINKEWFTFGDCYTVEALLPQNMLLSLAIMVSIDFVLASGSNNNG